MRCSVGVTGVVMRVHEAERRDELGYGRTLSRLRVVEEPPALEV